MKLYSVILLACTTLFCVHVQATDYYFSDFCNVRNKTIYPSSRGYDMSGSIRASFVNYYATGLNCFLQLNPPASSDGIELTVFKVDLRQPLLICLDTITIQSSKYSSGPWYNEMSGTCNVFFKQKYSNDGPMRIIFKTSPTTSYATAGSDFSISYTTYTYSRTGKIVGGVVGGVVFFCIVVGIASFIFRRRRRVVTTTTVVAPPPPPPPPQTMVYPQEQTAFANQLPPPYGYPQQQVPQQKNYYQQP